MTTVRLAPKRETLLSARTEIKQRNGCAVLLYQRLGSGKPPDRVGELLAINRRYGFELRRETPGAPWILANIDVDLSDGMRFGYGTPPLIAVRRWATCATTFELVPYFSWEGIKDPRFTLKDARTGVTGVTVEFAYRAPEDQSRIPSLKGSALYDPQRLWVLREYNVQAEWAGSAMKASAAATYEYEESAGEFLIPKRVVQRYTPVGGGDTEMRYEFDLKEAELPESEFTLSAFGLPEPTVAPRSIPPFLWAAGLGVVCLSLAAVLRWRRKRVS